MKRTGWQLTASLFFHSIWDPRSGREHVVCKPRKHIRLVDAIGKVCAAAQFIETKGSDRHDQVGFIATIKDRATRVTVTGAAFSCTIARGLDVESGIEGATEVHQ